jgi:hypothetical protein
MKRILLVTAFLVAGTVAAQADTTRWASNPPRGDAELHAAGQYCDAKVGPDRNGVPTSAQYKNCMKSQGWTYLDTVHDNYATWTNHRGMHCQSILNGFGSECSSFW